MGDIEVTPGLTRLDANILLVDDHEANLLALEEVLRPLGQRLVSVRSADDALRALLKEDFAVVLMDVRMPGMGGFEAARLIRQRQLIPIIFFTAFAGSAEEVLRGYEAGGVDYVTKPYDPAIVRNKVAIFVELWSAKENLRRSLLTVAERDLSLAERQRDAEIREQFIGILGHDLRTPLAAISMAADALADPETFIEPHVISAHIKRSTARMERMVRDVLDLARGRLGGGIPIVAKECDLTQVCLHVVDEVRVAHPGRAVVFEQSPGPATCCCDADRMSQVVSNLVSNAIQHGEDPVRVRLSEGPGACVLEVSNRGTPIARDALPRLFTPWAGKRRTGSNGLGLGLYIASEIVRAHRGKIDVRSSAEAGTVFTVTWPR